MEKGHVTMFNPDVLMHHWDPFTPKPTPSVEEQLATAQQRISALEKEVQSMREWGQDAWAKVGDLQRAIGLSGCSSYYEDAVARAKAVGQLVEALEVLNKPEPDYD